MVSLEHKVNFQDSIRPICLGTKELQVSPGETVAQTCGFGAKFRNSTKYWQTSCMTNEYGESKFENCIDSCKQKVPPDQDQDCETEKLFAKSKKVLVSKGITKDVAVAYIGSKKCYNPAISGKICKDEYGKWGFCGPACNPSFGHSLNYVTLLVVDFYECESKLSGISCLQILIHLFFLFQN